MTVKGTISRINEAVKVKGEGVEQITYLRNKDIIPMGPERRIWGQFSYMFYWSITNVTISTWSGASSLLSNGLSVGETMGIIIIGNVIIATLALLNAAPGGYYHIGYTISQRVVFGIRGSTIGIVIRIILSIVWFGSQAYLGSLCLSCIFSSWSSNYLNMKNTIPESVNMTTRDLVGFVIFQVISIPLLFLKPEKINKLLMVTCCATFFAMMGITIWAVTNNGGSNGPLMTTSSQMSSSARGWYWVYGISSWYGSLSSGVANQSDFTRFSRKTWSSFWGTIFSLIVIGTIIPLMGLVTASAMKETYKEEFWLPNSIIIQWLETNYSPKARAAAFFCGVSFTLSQLCFNTMGNGYAGGMDMAGILPKYITIKRGAVLTALLSWVVQPWDFYNTSSTFVTVMSSFSVFMSPIVAIITSDFWVIRRKKLKLSHLYVDDANGNYWYSAGWNYRSLIIWGISFAPGLPGLMNGANPSIKINSGIRNFYYGNCLFEFSIAFFLNCLSAYIWPYKNVEDVDNIDYFDSFTEEECKQRDMITYQQWKGTTNIDNVHIPEEGLLKELKDASIISADDLSS
ncbi:uncharacterized protein PRCAT00000024001 [Priceomyces carsonii]|uniref:uncharacterized protein n=1 Tax=Priceomyces carsonii TaxID=28549 RepID=UPI002EDA4565|nr:unnamed protein product [Priceomyces carsonii]